MRALALLALVAAQGSVLRWSPKEGDTLRYRTILEATVSGTTATLTAVSEQKVLRVDPDGSFLVQATPSEGKATYGGQEMPLKGPTTLTTYGPTGEIREIRGDRADSTGFRMVNLTEFHAPAKAVAVGDSWTSEGKGDPKTGAVAWKAEYKVVGEETIGAYPALKMDVNARETEGNDSGKATGSLWVGRDGVLVRAEIAWSNLSVPGAAGPVSGKITRTRL